MLYVDHDVIIVGARVAGSALAVLLSQQGHRVLLLDKAHFPSDTLSTHFFRAPALRVFERHGVLDEVRSAAPPVKSSLRGRLILLSIVNEILRSRCVLSVEPC